MDIEIVAEGLEFPEGPVVCEDGSVLVVEIRGGRITRIRTDGGKQIIAETGGAPNGMAIGPDRAIYCCNNGGVDWEASDWETMQACPAKDYTGGKIQRVDIATGKVETVYSDYQGRTFGGPNDIAFSPDGSFWFTDYGKWTPDGMRHGGLYHGNVNGSDLRRVNFGLSLNGVAVTPDGKTVYASATHERWLLAFDADPATGSQHGELLAHLPGRQFLDSMALEADGNVAVGCLHEEPGIARINVTSGRCEKVPMPDNLTTNIAFGGPDMRTAYITLTEQGALAKCRWPVAGMELPFRV